MEILLKNEKLNQLFFYYKSLLTKKQREYFLLYYIEDYSLQEIAEVHGVSRNAIFDQLNKTSTKLELYEEKLGLVKKAQLRYKYIKDFYQTKDLKNLEAIIEMDEQNE